MDPSGGGRSAATSHSRRGLRSQVDEERQAVEDAHAVTIEGLSREELASENRKLVEELERMKRMEEQLMRKNAELREDKRKVKAENMEQQRQLRSDGAEIERLRECYRATLEEKVALVEQLAVSNFEAAQDFALNLLS